MREDILKYLMNEIRRRCQSAGNVFGFSIYTHIQEMVHHAILLAKRNQADVEIVAISAWLRDIASITSFALYGERYIHSANMAKNILESLGYPAEKIKLVQKCILHFQLNSLEEHSVEEQCVADADAISKFDCLPSLFYQMYVQKGYSIEEGTQYICHELEDCYRRLSPSSREYYEEKYETVMKVLRKPVELEALQGQIGYIY